MQTKKQTLVIICSETNYKTEQFQSIAHVKSLVPFLNKCVTRIYRI